MNNIEGAGQASVSINARNEELGWAIEAQYSGNFEEEVILLEGSITTLDGAQSVTLSMEVPQQELQNLSFNEQDGSIIILDPDGNSSSYMVEEYSLTELGDENQTRMQSGTFIDGSGQRTAITLTDDPAPAAVALYIALAAMAGCIIKTSVEQYFANNHLNDLINACNQQGGFPKHSIKTTYGVRTNPFEIGCNAELQFECVSQ